MDLKLGFTLQALVDQGRVTKADVDRLRNSLEKELTDEQLALFLLACDNQQDRAQNTAVNYLNIRQMTPQVFADRLVSSERLQNQLRTGIYAILPGRTPNNCAIIFVKLQDSNYRNFDIESHVKLICMLLDAVTYSDPPDGLINVFDLQGTTFMHLTTVKLFLVKVISRYVQEALPLKLKAVHVFNGGYVLSALFNIFKPFLKSEVKELIHFHKNTNDMDSFHETWIAKEFLPEEYGGELPSVMVHRADTADKLAQMQSYFDADERQTREFSQ